MTSDTDTGHATFHMSSQLTDWIQIKLPFLNDFQRTCGLAARPTDYVSILRLVCEIFRDFIIVELLTGALQVQPGFQIRNNLFSECSVSFGVIFKMNYYRRETAELVEKTSKIPSNGAVNQLSNRLLWS